MFCLTRLLQVDDSDSVAKCTERLSFGILFYIGYIGSFDCKWRAIVLIVSTEAYCFRDNAVTVASFLDERHTSVCSFRFYWNETCHKMSGCSNIGALLHWVHVPLRSLREFQTLHWHTLISNAQVRTVVFPLYWLHTRWYLGPFFVALPWAGFSHHVHTPIRCPREFRVSHWCFRGILHTERHYNRHLLLSK